MKNYAGTDDKDDELAAELTAAGIEVVRMEILRERNSEVKTSVVGGLFGWRFTRAWRYWVAEGPGLPPVFADPLHAAHGQDVRVAGHCGCPSPLEWHRGFAVGMYHVDTQDGLKALADALKHCAADGIKRSLAAL